MNYWKVDEVRVPVFDEDGQVVRYRIEYVEKQYFLRRWWIVRNYEGIRIPNGPGMDLRYENAKLYGICSCGVRIWMPSTGSCMKCIKDKPSGKNSIYDLSDLSTGDRSQMKRLDDRFRKGLVEVDTMLNEYQRPSIDDNGMDIEDKWWEE